MDAIVDGYNLIFCCGWQGREQRPRSLERARNRLFAELAARIKADQRPHVTIVFDAKMSFRQQTPDENLTIAGFPVIFAHGHDEADTLIEELIRQHANPKSLTVVSNDNRLKLAATRRRAVAIDGDIWLEHLTRHGLNDHQTAPVVRESGKNSAIRELGDIDWLAEFELDSESAQPPLVMPTDLVADLSAETMPGLPRGEADIFPPGYGEDLLDELDS